MGSLMGDGEGGGGEGGGGVWCACRFLFNVILEGGGVVVCFFLFFLNA